MELAECILRGFCRYLVVAAVGALLLAALAGGFVWFLLDQLYRHG